MNFQKIIHRIFNPGIREFEHVSRAMGHPGWGSVPLNYYYGWNKNDDPFTILTKKEVKYYKRKGKI